MKIITAISFMLASLAAPVALSNPAISRALNEFNQAIVSVDNVEAQCYADRATLSPNVFDGLKLNAAQTRTVLSYFYYRTLTDCTETAVSNFLLKAAVLSSLNPEIASDISESNALITQPHVSLVKREVEYMQFSTELRTRLENIEALKTPFDLMSSSELLVPVDK